jgi:hypothetical protein
LKSASVSYGTILSNQIIGIPGRETKILKEIRIETFSNLMKTISPQIQEA